MKHCTLLSMALVVLLVGLVGLASGNDNEESIETILMSPADVFATLLKNAADFDFEYAKLWECDGLKLYAEPTNGGSELTHIEAEKYNNAAEFIRALIGALIGLYGFAPHDVDLGAVFHDGDQINTIYVREGLKRSWHWGFGEVEGFPNALRYRIELEDGMARYYDFKGVGADESVNPRSLYFC